MLIMSLIELSNGLLLLRLMVIIKRYFAQAGKVA